MTDADYEAALAKRGVTQTAWIVAEMPSRIVRVIYMRDGEQRFASFSGEDAQAQAMFIEWLDRIEGGA